MGVAGAFGGQDAGEDDDEQAGQGYDKQSCAQAGVVGDKADDRGLRSATRVPPVRCSPGAAQAGPGLYG